MVRAYLERPAHERDERMSWERRYGMFTMVSPDGEGWTAINEPFMLHPSDTDTTVHWDETLRKIETGSYSRHQFKAKLSERTAAPPEPAAPPPQDRKEIYQAFVEARRACGESVARLTTAKLDEILDRQERELRKRYGDGQIRFKVVVENGRAKLTASRGS